MPEQLPSKGRVVLFSTGASEEEWPAFVVRVNPWNPLKVNLRVFENGHRVLWFEDVEYADPAVPRVPDRPAWRWPPRV